MERILNNFFFILFFFLALCFSVYSSDIKNEMELGTYLDIDKSEMEQVLKNLYFAKNIVIKQEARKKRKLSFGKPVKFFDLSNKYCVLAYSANVNDEEPAIVAFLIIKTPENLEIPETTPYLIWKGKADLKSFDSVSENIIAKYFRGMGINDLYSVYSQDKLRKEINSKADKIHFHKGEDIRSGMIDEKYIDPSITRDSELKEALSKKADISVVASFKQEPKSSGDAQTYSLKIQQMQMQIDELTKQVKRLQYILKGVGRKKNEIYFRNVNIRVLNGTGKTDSVNGTGNIIIGYNENGSVKGSHSLVVGKLNKCEGTGNIVSGLNNTARTSYGAVIGGEANRAAGSFATIIGGKGNYSAGKFSTVAGGEGNSAKGDFSIISGGKNRSVLNKNPHFTQ